MVHGAERVERAELEACPEGMVHGAERAWGREGRAPVPCALCHAHPRWGQEQRNSSQAAERALRARVREVHSLPLPLPCHSPATPLPPPHQPSVTLIHLPPFAMTLWCPLRTLPSTPERPALNPRGL